MWKPKRFDESGKMKTDWYGMDFVMQLFTSSEILVRSPESFLPDLSS